MTSGRGLESLIPPLAKKNSTENQGDVGLESSAEPVLKNNVSISGSFSTSYARDKERIDRKNPPVRKHFGETKMLSSEAIFHIEIEKIKPNPFQPRREFNQESLQELARSISEFGILQPLIVSKIIKETEIGAAVEYQLIAGERRLIAAKLIGLERVPVIIKNIDLQRTKLEMSLIENIQRSDLNSLEQARAYARLQDEFGLIQREIAQRLGKSRQSVANSLRLLNLPLLIQEALAQNKLNESQALALLALENQTEQLKAFAELLNKKLTVRSLREKTKKSPPADFQKSYIESRLEENLGAPVKILKEKNGKGKIIINFYSPEEEKAILEKILGESNELNL